VTQHSDLAFDYSTQAFNIRSDIPTAFRDVWSRFSKPGNWFSAEDRLAIAAEVRHAEQCALCASRANALSPAAVQGQHDAQTNLAEPLVDAVHRVRLDASRLSQSWLEAFYAAGYSDAHYVELVGLVVALVSIDAFHLALGLPREPLPLPLPAEGMPDRYRPPGAKDSGAWVPTVMPEALTAPEADMYNGGKSMGNVATAMSLVPDSVRMLITLSNAQYLPMQQVADPELDGGRAINRAQIELLAGRVSALNECFY